MPTVEPSALQAQIAAGQLPPVLLLVGEDTRLIESIADGIENTVDPADRPFAVERLYAGEEAGSPVAIAAAARAFPMLGDRRIVFVLRAERLLKPRRGGKAADAARRASESEDSDEAADGDEAAVTDMAPLEDYLGDPVPSTTLVFIAADIDRGRRFTKRLMATAVVTECFGLAAATPAGRRDARQIAADWLRAELARAGRPGDPAAMRLLLDRAGQDISKLRGDVDRLLLYTEGRSRITEDDVEEVAADGAWSDDWAMVDALGDGDAGRALRELAHRVDRGDSVHQMLGQLRWWVSTRLAEADPSRVRPALDALLRTDRALKGSGGEPRVLLERLVLELTGRPVTQPRWGGRR